MTTEAAFWDDLAVKYSKKAVPDPEAFERKIAITKGLMRPEHVVLEIGCGTGSLALRLAPCAAQFHGLDISPEMIRIAREKARDTANVTFHAGPFDDSFTTFGPGTVDGVCAYSILHLLHDRPAVLRRIFDLLAPGGFFVSSTACLDNTWVPYRPLLTVMRWLGKAPYVGFLSTEVLLAEIAEAGFVDVQTPDVGAAKAVAFVTARRPG